MNITSLKQRTQEAGDFFNAVKDAANKPDGTFDSAAATEFVLDGVSRSDTVMPEKMQILFDEVGKKHIGSVTQALLDGANKYREAHGMDVPPDLIEYAMHMGFTTTQHAIDGLGFGLKFDSATSDHGDNLSLQPNRAVVSILMALSEGIPFAHYLPVDIGSNQAKLAILSHLAGKQYGGYAASGLMDGQYSGDAFINSGRIHLTTSAAGAHTGQITSVQATDETCAAVAGNVVAVNLLRGRSIVYVNGIPCAKEVSASGTGNSTVSGSITIASTTYQIGGTINTDTGVIALTSTPALNNAIPVVVEAFIDYERQPSLIPNMVTSADVYDIFALPGRVYTQQTPDARTQMQNELGVDPYSESLMAIQLQYANERHFDLLRKARRLATNSTGTFDFAWTTQGAQKTRSQILQDFAAKLSAVSQEVALKTLGFGISHLYVGNNMKSMIMGMPSDMFQPSGIQERAGIFRIGRLFGRYEVYYDPKVVSDSVSTSSVLCIGKAPDVARNPFVMGDAVAPTVIPLGVGTDLKAGSGFYVRGFQAVNPHQPSAMACASISVTNMGM